jgi:hypothetical protein
MTICKAPDCQKDTRSPGAKYCEMHYYRLRRSHTTDKVCRRSPFLVQSSCNIHIYAPQQPLTKTHKGAYEYQHRIVYFNAYGPGPFRCHWCNNPIEWSTLHVDHLNEIVDDNRLENLVASCPLCNQQRGRDKMIATMQQMHATWIDFHGQRKMLTDWAESIGIGRSTLQARLKAGWQLERALAQPRGKSGPRRATTGNGNQSLFQQIEMVA